MNLMDTPIDPVLVFPKDKVGALHPLGSLTRVGREGENMHFKFRLSFLLIAKTVGGPN